MKIIDKYTCKIFSFHHAKNVIYRFRKQKSLIMSEIAPYWLYCIVFCYFASYKIQSMLSRNKLSCKEITWQQWWVPSTIPLNVMVYNIISEWQTQSYSRRIYHLDGHILFQLILCLLLCKAAYPLLDDKIFTVAKPIICSSKRCPQDASCNLDVKQWICRIQRSLQACKGITAIKMTGNSLDSYIQFSPFKDIYYSKFGVFLHFCIS